MHSTIPLMMLLAVAVTAAPKCDVAKSLTFELIEKISPSSSTCKGASFPEECRTAQQAIQPIIKSFQKYELNTAGEQAAALAIIVFESAGFKYNRNHFPEPGRPGQGTRNMQMIEFNRRYALYVHGESAVAAAKDHNAVLELVLNDNDSFGSAAWFISQKCSETIKQGLRAGTMDGWKDYLTECVGTPVTEERNRIWQATLQALKP